MSLPQRTSAAAHIDMQHANPLEARQMAHLVQQLAAMHPKSVLEIGCGPGTFSIELAKATCAAITALDINPDFVARARTSSASQQLLGRIDFQERSATDLCAEKFEAVVCIGSSQAFGNTTQALHKCVSFVQRGGCVLFGDLVWRRNPDSEFLGLLGSAVSDFWFASDASEIFRQANLALFHEETASPEAWRQYESNVLSGRHRFAATLPSEEADLVRSRADAWFSIYEQYGQHSLGFAAYLATSRS